MPQAGLELVGVHKQYHTVQAVCGISFTVKQGEFFSLLGPSGCGKTTTLRMVAGFVSPTAGRILLDGRDITPLPPEKRQMGMVFQNYAVFPHMRVFENISFGLQIRKKKQHEIEHQVQAALSQVGLSGYEERYPRQLSGGEQQRVALARALVIEPRLMLLDEPLSALDKRLREEMKYWIKRLQSELGITTIYVTHDQSEAMTLSDRIAVMNNGRVEQIGTPRDIYEQPATRFVSSFIGESNMLQGEVVAVENDRITVAIGAAQVKTRALRAISARQSVTVMVRPESILLGEAASSLSWQPLVGEIVSEIYQGAIIRYEIKLPGDFRLVAESHNINEREIFPVGASVPVGWMPDSSIVLME
ncbi:MAG: ABC transporter ATP-binding protein [Anaerolineales bacterium]|jgi:putative spermidine/putrescine transport system ATP-binding protein|nr:ABC transporter ATP-binding protein [Arenicellales bacterium]MDP7644509.1 ABC transporter ATP-binding protein [Anaerolineales bacterium]|tara:strand:+ start:1719 stop:2798 length:1080 start_codon:yes stop_codon:yes gene_type:complete